MLPVFETLIKIRVLIDTMIEADLRDTTLSRVWDWPGPVEPVEYLLSMIMMLVQTLSFTVISLRIFL